MFYDSSYQQSASFDSKAVTRYLSAAGYATLDATGLASWLDDRIADRKPSTLVFAIDYLPTSLADGDLAQSPLRRYLDSGGRVVWPGAPPLLWPRDPATGELGAYNTIRYDAPGRLLGVSHDHASFDPRGTHATARGTRWGLNGYWKDNWSVPLREVSEALAIDEWGLASSWTKPYGGTPGTGFIRIPGADPRVIYLVAETRPGSRKPSTTAVGH
ncbi:MAG: hypothetical protein ABJC74_02925 [Gemmatimonadota bacterium]